MGENSTAKSTRTAGVHDRYANVIQFQENRLRSTLNPAWRLALQDLEATCRDLSNERLADLPRRELYRLVADILQDLLEV